jgi:hypothetical protein
MEFLQMLYEAREPGQPTTVLYAHTKICALARTRCCPCGVVRVPLPST